MYESLDHGFRGDNLEITHSTIGVGETAGAQYQLLAANPRRVWALLMNVGDSTYYADGPHGFPVGINFGDPAFGAYVQVVPGGSLFIGPDMPYLGRIDGRCATGQATQYMQVIEAVVRQ